MCVLFAYLWFQSHHIGINPSENLHDDLIGEVKRLARFLNVGVTTEKLTAILDRTSFPAMKKANEGSIKAELQRKGIVGDYKNHDLPWGELEKVFLDKLGSCEIASPLIAKM